MLIDLQNSTLSYFNSSFGLSVGLKIRLLKCNQYKILKKLFLLILFCFLISQTGVSQILCIKCFDQNDSISSGVHNFFKNGSFEDTIQIDDQQNSFCPKSFSYGFDFSNWICTGGGRDTYASICGSSYGTYLLNGKQAAYFGNTFCKPCVVVAEDTSCIKDSLCIVTGIQTGFPINDGIHGRDTGVSLEQTVFGLIPGEIYVLEFWVGGELGNNFFTSKGLFAVDIGFGKTFLRNNATSPLLNGNRFILEFMATSTSHTIKFTNWGHICLHCTELILDDVRMYKLDELSPSVEKCISGLIPVVNISCNDNYLCEKQAINFYDLSAKNPTSWQWFFPGANPNSSNLQNPTGIYYANSGTFSVTLIACNAYGCDSLTFDSFIKEIDPAELPTINIINDTLCVSSYISYSWFEVTNPSIILSTNQCFLPIDSGNYFITVIDSNGCDLTSLPVKIITGTVENITKTILRINFNNASNELTVRLNNNYPADVIIYDLSSRILKQQNFIGSTSLSLRLQASGIYFYEVRSKMRIFDKGKIIKN